MADKTLFQRLYKLFSTDVIVRNIGGKKLKVADVNHLQSMGGLETNFLIDRFTKLHSASKPLGGQSGYGGSGFGRGIAGPYLAARMELLSDYDSMDTDPIIASALDIYADESTVRSETGYCLTIKSDNEDVTKVLKNLFYDVLNIEFNLWSWIRGMPMKWDTLIPLLSGEQITILELSERIKNGEEVWVYSVQDKTGRVVPGKVTWCDKNYTSNTIIKITLDDDSIVECAPEHPFILRDGTELRADELKSGMSLMPFYRGKSKYNYETVYNPETNNYIETHKLVADSIGIKSLTENLKEKLTNCKVCGKKLVGSQFKYCSKTCSNTAMSVVHHIDFNKENNSPPNLKRMNFYEHQKYHSQHAIKVLHTKEVTEKRLVAIKKFLSSDRKKRLQSERQVGKYPGQFKSYNNSQLHKEHNKIRSESLKKLFTNPEFKELMKNKWTPEMQSIYFETFNLCGVNRQGNPNWTLIYDTLLKNDKFMLLWNSTNTRAFKPSTVKYNIDGVLNHKVKSVETIFGKEDVYCMTVMGPNDEHDRHNFAICTKDIHGKSTNNGIFVKNCKYGDFFLKLDISEKYGVVNVHPISTFEVLREEGFDPMNPSSVQFRVQNAAYIQSRVGPNAPIYQNYEIAHFRLLGDSNFLPYGRSTIEPARKLWKQLTLMEDAMLIHRIMRAPEKRIFKIDIGNIPPAQVDEYMRQVMDRMKKAPYVNPTTGDYNLKYNMMNITEDFYLPTRPGDTTTSIDTLKGLEFNAIEDIEYLKAKLLSALKVPKAFLGFDEKLGGKATLAAEDVRFARTIERIQRIIESELYKIAIVHLYSQGFDDKDLVDFSLQLTNPSTVYEQEKLAIIEQRLKIANDMKDLNLFSTDYVYEELFNMSEEDIDKEREKVADDMRRRFRFKQMEDEGNDPTKTGRSFGTPHDLASMNVLGREYSVKNNEPMDKTTNSDGQEIDFGATNIRRNEKNSFDGVGMNYGQDEHPRGRDPLGKNSYFNTVANTNLSADVKPNFTMRSPFPMESLTSFIDNIKTTIKTKQILVESLNAEENKKEEPKMLDENNLNI